MVENGPNNKLSEKENEERLKTCGKVPLPSPSSNETDVQIQNGTNEPPTWLLWITGLKNVTGSTPIVESAAFLISDRHVFTSSQVLLDSKQKYLLDNEKLDCTKSTPGVLNKDFEHVEVPLKYLKTIGVIHLTSRHTEHITRGILFSTCGMNNFGSEFSPLLLEFGNTDQKHPLPCLAENVDVSKVGASVDSYGLHNASMSHHKVKILKIVENRWILTSKFDSSLNRGGPLAEVVNGTSTVIGLKASDGTRNVEEVYYYDIGALSQDICDWSGVCPPKNITEDLLTPEPTTAPTSSTSAIPLVRTTIKSRTTTKLKPTLPKKNQSEDETNDDSEKIGNDFFVEKDFKNTGFRRNLNYSGVGFLVWLLVR